MSEFSEILSQHIHNKDIKTYALAQYCGLDRSNMYKVINGKRKPTSEAMVDKMCKFMHLSPAEENELKEAYMITLTGTDNYYRRKDVLHFFSEFNLTASDLPIINYRFESISSSEDVILLNTPSEVNRALLNIVSMDLHKENGHIRMLIQPDNAFLMNLLVAEDSRTPGVCIDHLICLNNNAEATYSHKNYNLHCLKQVLPLYGSSYEYNCFYYYDNIAFNNNSLILFPYIIITSEYACLLTSDMTRGYMTRSAASVKMFINIFKEHLNKSSPLLRPINSPFVQLEYVKDLWRSGSMGYSFQMTPCFTPFITLELMEKCIKKGIPERELLISSFHSYIQEMLHDNKCKPVSYIFSYDGVEHFLKTGQIAEYPPQVYVPLEMPDRILIVKQLLQACRTHSYRMLKNNVGNMDNELFLCVNHQKGYLMFATPFNQSLVYLDIEEPGLLFTFLDFCENLDSSMFYTKEEAIEKIKFLINVYKEETSG